MKPYYADAGVTIHHGDCLDVLRQLPDASVDAVVTDPPAGIAFMSREWDDFRRARNVAYAGREDVFGRTSRSGPEYGRGARGNFVEWLKEVMAEALRVTKPGGHALVWAIPRTSHWTALAIEDAGWVIRDRIAHHFGSGFPKSHNLTGEWEGWGTALKPATEDWWLARKPLAGTVAANVLAHGVGALNIDGCRVGMTDEDRAVVDKRSGVGFGTGDTVGANQGRAEGRFTSAPAGRWPANVVLDESQAAALDEQSGESASVGKPRSRGDSRAATQGATRGGTSGGFNLGNDERTDHGDAGGASRFFYVAERDDEFWCYPCSRGQCQDCSGIAWQPDIPCQHEHPAPPDDELSVRFLYAPKADASERVRVDGTAHPTVKPLALMRWLVRLVTPPGGTVLEPFAGSGTTVEACILEGFACIAIEREADYLPLIRQRIHRRRDPVEAVRGSGEDAGLFDLLGGEPA